MPVPRHSRSAIVARVVLLPVLLVGATVAGLGSYYETSDDAALGWLFAGVLTPHPLGSVPLYFHGVGHLLAAAYAAAPGVPWLGLGLGGLLLAATGLVFAVLDRLLRSHLRPVALIGALVGFYGGAWLEHWLWFSHARVALLLAVAALLFAAQRPARRGPWAVGLAGLGLAWLLRPNLALLALGAALPAAYLLAGGGRRVAPLVVSAVLALALATGLSAAWRTPAEARTQARNAAFARILDFEQRRPQPRTAADSLGTAAIAHWLLGDSSVVNEALCQRAYRADATGFWTRTVPAKLAARAAQLARDYFPMLAALAATAMAAGHRRRLGGFWLLQLGFAVALGLLAGVFKLPPRLALPLLDCWLLANLTYRLQPAGENTGPPGRVESASSARPAAWLRSAGVAVALALGGLYGAKTLHRRGVLRAERARHEQGLRELGRRPADGVLVLAGATDLLKSLSPFREYRPGPGPVLLLTGWPAHDPAQAAQRRALSGAVDQTECLRRRAAPGRATRWVLSAACARWLNRRFRFGAGPGPVPALVRQSALAADTSLQDYRPRWR